MQTFDKTLGDMVLRPFAANGVPGELVAVRTNLGTRVAAWRATNPQGNPQTSYFCHGYSLGTFMFSGPPPTPGYSVLSGEDMLGVLADEYTKIGNLRGPGLGGAILARPRDLIIWWRGRDPVHSALIEVPAVNNGKLDENATLVNSKTGTGIVRIRVPLAVVHRDYRTTSLVEVYRRN